VYTREVNGKELELGVSGRLYKDALVMFDRETRTLWTQVDGKALRGPLAGSRLTEVPAVQTTWKAWKMLHPDTLVLRKPGALRGSAYDGYFQDPSRRGLSGTRGDERLGGKEKVVGVHEAGEVFAVPQSLLEKRTVVQFLLRGRPVVVVYDREAQTPGVYRAVLNGKALSFRASKRGGQTLVEDVETGSLWSPLEGKAISGPLAGKQLDRLPYQYSFWYAWSAYHPETHVVGK
jgi:uncharacterized protein DUF3179